MKWRKKKLLIAKYCEKKVIKKLNEKLACHSILSLGGKKKREKVRADKDSGIRKKKTEIKIGLVAIARAYRQSKYTHNNTNACSHFHIQTLVQREKYMYMVKCNSILSNIMAWAPTPTDERAIIYAQKTSERKKLVYLVDRF